MRRCTRPRKRQRVDYLAIESTPAVGYWGSVKMEIRGQPIEEELIGYWRMLAREALEYSEEFDHLVHSLPIRLSPTATSGSVRPCSWTFTSVAIFGSHNRSQSSSDFFPTTRPAPPTWRRLAGATGLFAPIVSRGVSANHPSRLRKPENVAERHPSRGQSPAPASLPQRIHLPFQQAVLSVQRLPFPAQHRGRRHRTLPTQSFTPEPGSILHVGGVGNNRIGKVHSIEDPTLTPSKSNPFDIK